MQLHDVRKQDVNILQINIKMFQDKYCNFKKGDNAFFFILWLMTA